MFSVVFECFFPHACFCRDMIYNIGEKDYFSLILTADSFSTAYDRALSYAEDEFSMADCSIYSIIRIS